MARRIIGHSERRPLAIAQPPSPAAKLGCVMAADRRAPGRLMRPIVSPQASSMLRLGATATTGGPSEEPAVP